MADQLDQLKQFTTVVADTGDFEAMKEFLTAIRIDPNQDEAHRNLGILFMKTGRLKEAVREFQIASDLAPDNTTLRESLEMLKGMIKWFD